MTAQSHNETHEDPDLVTDPDAWSPDTKEAHKIDLLTANVPPPPLEAHDNVSLNADLGAAVLVLPNPRDIVASLRKFPEISLEETNRSAQMLTRVDNKYDVDKARLLEILDDLKDEFKILKIDNRSIFSYKSCYFDDNSQCFWEHQQGRRHRFKVRTRLYVESDRSYFEVKLKGKRGQTEKSRMKCVDFESYAVADSELQMLRRLYEESYGKKFLYSMKPALHVSYKRFTLVSSSGGERVTVDFNIGFETPSGKRAQIGENFIIVETKSADGRGKSDLVLKRHHIRQAEGCSKYCIGMVLAGEVQRFNKFRPIVRTVRSRMQRPHDGEAQPTSARPDGSRQQRTHAGPSSCAK